MGFTKIHRNGINNRQHFRPSLHVQVLQLVEHLVAVGPDVELPRELGDDEVRLPAAQLLRLEDVAEDVVAKVEDVLALRPDHLGQHIARSCQ